MTKETGYKPENEGSNLQISRLCAVVSVKSEDVFIGWSNDGKPQISSNKANLSGKAADSYKYSEDIESVRGINLNSITPVEYAVRGRIIDKTDRKSEKTQDLISLECVDPDGQDVTILIKEYELLQAIKKQTLVWEDINTNTKFATDEVIPGVQMYTLLLSINGERKKSKRKQYAVLFNPVLKDESNEYAYKRFLVEMIQGLVILDERQDEDNQKGYIYTLSRNLGRSKARGGAAYQIMRSLASTGLVDISSKRLSELKLSSDKKDKRSQLLLLAKEFGLVTSTSSRKRSGSESTKNKLEDLSIDELIGLISDFERTASTLFTSVT